VPRSHDADEDDEWLMGLVIEAHGQGIALEILSASDVESGNPRIQHRLDP
jgi:carotenoid cleavage dioxygenase